MSDDYKKVRLADLGILVLLILVVLYGFIDDRRDGEFRQTFQRIEQKCID